MNRLRAQKYKTNTDNTKTNGSGSIHNNINNNNNNMNSNNNSNNNGLLTKITKRYSTFSNKITKRHQAVRRSTSPPRAALWGSYDMTGANSEDHRLEIGAPVLISTTTIDTDRFDVTEERLRQIGGGIAATSTLIRTITLPMCHGTAHSSPQIPSSGSENEVFVDALCNTPRAEGDDEEEGDVEEEILMEEEIEVKTETEAETTASEIKEQFDLSLHTPKTSKMPPAVRATPNSNTTTLERTHGAQQLSNYYETPKTKPRNKPKLGCRQHSKSAQNLHRTELKMFLQKAPSMELDMSLTTANLEHCIELPRLPELYGVGGCNMAPTTPPPPSHPRANILVDVDIDADDDDDDDKENTSPARVLNMCSPLQLSKSAPNTPMCALDDKVSGYLVQQQQFQSVDSLSLSTAAHRVAAAKRRKSVVFASNSNNSSSLSRHTNDSKQSLVPDHSSLEDFFDLKSVSCQSLTAQNLFLSIEELNEITRQINESEEFNNPELDLEYCTHRDNLRPSERRITLMKNKNSRMCTFNHNKEKLKKSWSGVKHWLGEESSKLREVVHKQAALQRVGVVGSKLNLSNAPCRAPLSTHGGSVLLLRNGTRAESQHTLSDATLQASKKSGEVREEDSPNKGVEINDDAVLDDLDSSLTLAQVDEISPAAKRAKREGQNGFEELRRYIKQGGDFGKELVLILQERVESELSYSKSLSKMANKLNKACRELPGSIADAWRGVATEMESRSDIHRQLSTSLTDEIVKPLKNIVETHHKTRKTVESNVDKAARVLCEWRVSEAKAKKSSHTAARENEKLQDAMLDVRIQKSPSIALLNQSSNKMVMAEKELKSAEKDCAKLDSKRKKAEEAVKRADVEYYTLCVRAERARADWEMSVLRGSSLLQNIEHQRLGNMKNFVTNYVRLTSNMNPILDALMQRLQPQIEACSVPKDMQVVKNIRRISEGPSEQLLPDFYCEHTTLAMNRERRKQALVKLLQLVKTDLERERRSRNGLKGLSQSLNNQEHQNITDKLYHIRSMLTYLEGARFKLHSALLELDHKPRTSHPLAQHIQITRDRTGLQQSILKVPLWLKNNDKLSAAHNSSGDDSINANDYDCISQTNGSNNVSCIELNRELNKPFKRSKSNIETFSSNTEICVSAQNKNQTIASNAATDAFFDRGQADGGSNQHDSDFDEFSSQDDSDDDDDDDINDVDEGDNGAENEKQRSTTAGHRLRSTTIGTKPKQNGHQLYQSSIQINSSSSSENSVKHNGSAVNSIVLSRCKALYSYTPKLYDELELYPGDIIEVHAKQDDGWWLGALRNRIGIFPATYVEEFV